MVCRDSDPEAGWYHMVEREVKNIYYLDSNITVEPTPPNQMSSAFWSFAQMQPAI
jgi:hypothetical protein